MTTGVRILRHDEVRTALPMAACIDAVEAAFVAYSTGGAQIPSVIHLDVPEAGGEIHVKAGHLDGAPAYEFVLFGANTMILPRLYFDPAHDTAQEVQLGAR